MNPLIPSLMQGRDDIPTSLEDWLRRPHWPPGPGVGGQGTELYIRGPKARYDEEVLALCRECPVRQECLETALADPDLQGLWGGTTDAERREMRRQRRVA